MARTAISYTRFSSARQALGHSEERQVESARQYTREKGFVLREITDRGVSSFRGRNVSEGVLGSLIRQVKTGDLPRDTVLLVEDPDRVSRETWAQAYPKIYEPLCQAGIEIHFLSFRAVLKPDHSFADLLQIGIKHDLGHIESEKKSNRLGEVWSKKRHTANGKTAMSERVPAWLIAEKGQPIQVRSERAKIVRQIFTWANKGLGQYQICDKLIAARVAPWGPVFKGRPPKWTPFYVGEILRNERLLGYYQPMTKVRVETDPETGEKRRVPLKKRVPDGDLVKNYYPQVISHDLWQKVQEVRRAFAQAKFGESLHAGKNKFSDKNLFRKLVWDANGNAPMVYHNYEGYPCLVTTYRQKLRQHKIPYQIFESTFLKFLSEADWQAIANENADTDSKLQDQLESVAKGISENEIVLFRYEALLDNPGSRDSQRVIAKYQSALKEAKRLSTERDRLQSEINLSRSSTLLSGQGKKFGLHNTEDRLRLRLWIAQAVSRIELYFADPENKSNLIKEMKALVKLGEKITPDQIKFAARASLIATLNEGQVSIRVVFSNGAFRQILLKK